MANEKRLIDANKVFERADEVTFMGFRAEERKKHFMDLVSEILKQPTVDAVEVAHGEWMEDYETFVDDSGQESYPIQTGYVCSECGVDGSPIWRYCPHCGAKMRRME